MKDNIKITTKWNRWREADISKTDIVDHITEPGIYFFSADAWGVKGKLPGGKHSWVALFADGEWTTLEITDIETVKVQGANVLYAERGDIRGKQLIISDRHPATKWFGNAPTLLHYSPNIDTFFKNYQIGHKHGKVHLLTNNCNTFVSFIMWACEEDKRFRYVGYKSGKHWNKKYKLPSSIMLQ